MVQLAGGAAVCLAVPARVVELRGEGVGVVELDGLRREVNLELVPEARVGDYVVIHVGYALSRIDTAEAAATLAAFSALEREDDALPR